MKVHFTKKEYQALLEMVYIADWVLHAHDTGDNPDTEIYRALEQKLLGQAKDFGLGDCVEVCSGSGENMLNKDFLERSKVMARVEKFENATFWEELLERLARRDFIRQYGEKAILEMSLEERFTKEMIIHEQYDKEFSENGLLNISVIRKTLSPENNN